MEVAHIAPYSMLHLTLHKRFHMLLPSFLQNPDYREHFSTLAESPDKFVIMDNGMFEDGLMTNDRLIDLAHAWRVNEIVMPDVRGDSLATLKAVDNFLNMFELITLPRTPSLMCVVQIRNISEMESFLYTAADIERLHFGHNGVFTFGVPRRLAEEIDPYIRIKIAQWVSMVLPTNPIHFLGYARNSTHPKQFNEVQEASGIVRSIDTDAPFVWAINQAFMDTSGRYERPPHYMETTMISDRHLEINDRILNRWASGRA